MLFKLLPGEGGRLANESEWEPLHDLLVLVIHDVDHVALDLHQHFLSPDAVGLLHGQEPPHPVGRVDEVVFWRNGERGQVLQHVGRTHGS